MTEFIVIWETRLWAHLRGKLSEDWKSKNAVFPVRQHNSTGSEHQPDLGRRHPCPETCPLIPGSPAPTAGSARLIRHTCLPQGHSAVSPPLPLSPLTLLPTPTPSHISILVLHGRNPLPDQHDQLCTRSAPVVPILLTGNCQP